MLACRCLVEQRSCTPECAEVLIWPWRRYVTQVEKGGKDWERIAAEACRTIPGRENGGNCDIKNLSRGCKVYFPVFVEGANLSMGDMHFSQGDGEVSFCGAIEMSGFLELKYGAFSSLHALGTLF